MDCQKICCHSLYLLTCSKNEIKECSEPCEIPTKYTQQCPSIAAESSIECWKCDKDPNGQPDWQVTDGDGNIYSVNYNSTGQYWTSGDICASKTESLTFTDLKECKEDKTESVYGTKDCCPEGWSATSQVGQYPWCVSEEEYTPPDEDITCYKCSPCLSGTSTAMPPNDCGEVFAQEVFGTMCYACDDCEVDLTDCDKDPSEVCEGTVFDRTCKGKKAHSGLECQTTESYVGTKICDCDAGYYYESDPGCLNEISYVTNKGTICYGCDTCERVQSSDPNNSFANCTPLDSSICEGVEYDAICPGKKISSGESCDIPIKLVGRADEIWTPWYPDPSTVCEGTEFYQFSYNECNWDYKDQTAYGTAPITNWSEWAPDASTRCPNIDVFQSRSNNCGGYEYQTVTGTKTGCATCSDCNLESDPLACTNQPDKIAVETTIQAGSSCNGEEVGEDLVCYDCLTCNRDNYPWTPDEAEVCNGVLFIQTRDGDYPECTQTRDATGTKSCELKMPISVYKVGGLSISRINGVDSYPCIGCGYVLQGQITAESGAGSSVNITCAVGNEYNSREGVGVDAEGTVLTYRNSTTQNLTITYQNCLDGIFNSTTNWCGY